MSIVPAIDTATLIGAAWHDLAVAAIVGVSPRACHAGPAPLERLKFGLARKSSVLFIERPAYFMANHASNKRARHRSQRTPRALADRITDKATGDRANRQPRIGTRRSIRSAPGNRQCESRCNGANCDFRHGNTPYLPQPC
jgi:hypothetical protein